MWSFDRDGEMKMMLEIIKKCQCESEESESELESGERVVRMYRPQRRSLLRAETQWETLQRFRCCPREAKLWASAVTLVVCES